MRLLSPTEQAYVDGTREFTKTQQRYIRYRLRKKLRLVDEQSRDAAAALPRRLEDDDDGVVRISRRYSLVNEENDADKGKKGADPGGFDPPTCGYLHHSNNNGTFAAVPKTAAIS